jgi:hypothetical protein
VPVSRSRSLVARADLGWVTAAVAVVYAAWAVALLVEPRRFFLGDTAHAYYGWMWQLGDGLRHGTWPLLDVSAMSAGNHVAEGQMGLYNPLMALFGLAATVAPSVVAYMTLLKFLVGAIGVTGAYVLARSYGVRPPLAAVAGIATALCGLSFTSEVPRWFDGQLGVALLPWAWWALRRLASGRSPLPALVLCYLVITIGYIYPTFYLAVVLVGLLVEELLTRRRRELVRLALAGVFCALVVVVVYLPGVETLPVTLRTQTLTGKEGLFRLLPWQYLLTSQPANTAPTTNGLESVPWRYVFWGLPLFVLVRWRAVPWRRTASLWVPVALMLVWSRLPNEVGPIRWPGRTLDALTLVVVLWLVVLLEQGVVATRRRIALVLALVALTAVVTIGAGPSHWPLHVVATVLTGTAVVLVARRLFTRPAQVGAALLGLSALVAVGQTLVFTDVGTSQRNPPSALSAYDDYLPGSVGGTLVVNAASVATLGEAAFTTDRGRHLLTGSLWGMTGKPVLNDYSTIGFRPYSGIFCTTVIGDVCPRAVDAMLAKDATTGLTRAELFGVSTLVVGIDAGKKAPATPHGWHVTARNRYAVTWVRDKPFAPPGSVSYTSPGVEVTTLSHGDLGTSFRVDSVPAGGGRVVLSRLAWPGYRVSGAEQVDPLQDMLLQVEVSPDDVGKVVDVTFRPPGWTLEITCWSIAVLGALAWSLLEVVRRRRRRAGTSSGRRRAVPLPG